MPLSLACEEALAEARSAVRQWALTGELPPCATIPSCVLRLSLQTAGETYGVAAQVDKSLLPAFPWPEEAIDEFLELVFDDFSAAAVEHCIDQYATEAEERWRNKPGGGGSHPPEIGLTQHGHELSMPVRENAPAPSPGRHAGGQPRERRMR